MLGCIRWLEIRRVSTGSHEVEGQIVSSEGEDDEMYIRLLDGLRS